MSSLSRSLLQNLFNNLQGSKKDRYLVSKTGQLLNGILDDLSSSCFRPECGKRLLRKIGDKIKEIKQREIAPVFASLCEHLRLLGLDARVESEKTKWGWQGGIEFAWGAIRVANQNIDSVGLEFLGDELPLIRCNYIVQAKVEGLEDRVKAELKLVRKSFWSREVVDFTWEGRNLAQVLNRDANLRDMLYRMKNTDTDLLPLEIKPYREHQCIRIRPRGGTHRPASAFPTAETFEAYDRIAQHIRSIANARP